MERSIELDKPRLKDRTRNGATLHDYYLHNYAKLSTRTHKLFFHQSALSPTWLLSTDQAKRRYLKGCSISILQSYQRTYIILPFI